MNLPPHVTTVPDWQLPPGVARGTWDYSQASFIATDYDAYFGRHAMFELDRAIIERHLTEPGVVVDLGCGTGRALLPLVQRGFQGIGIDLSQHMLQVLQEKARREGLSVECVRGNLVELQFLDDHLADYLLCLFSTLGMIRGAENRRQVLAHARRIARPGGLLVLHVHNYWNHARIASRRGWLVRNLIGSWLGRAERGDQYNDYRAIRDFYLHAFTQRELRSLLSSTGWEIERWYAVNLRAEEMERPTKRSTWFQRLAAQGWVVVCRRPA